MSFMATLRKPGRRIFRARVSRRHVAKVQWSAPREYAQTPASCGGSSLAHGQLHSRHSAMRATSRIEAYAEPAPSPQAPYQLSSEQVVSSLHSDSERGLPANEVRARLAQYGKNELAAEEPEPG